LLVSAISASPALAADCTGNNYFFTPQGGTSPAPVSCGDGFRCHDPEQPSQPYIVKTNANCDPMQQFCEVQLRVPWEFPGNIQNDLIHPVVYWYRDAPQAPPCDPFPNPNCGQTSICGVPGQQILVDFIETYTRASARCSDLTDPRLGVYSLTGFTCLSSCQHDLDVDGVQFTPQAVAAALGCPPPPPPPRKHDCGCTCTPGAGDPGGGGPGAGPGSGGPGGGPGDTGPGASLRYSAAGAGGEDYAGSPEWNVELGQYWSHDYAQRVVLDPVTQNDGHVWLITETATFREFTNLVGDRYETVSPSDEFRELHRTGSGWELRGLEGTVVTFDATGRWVSKVDRNGNATEACYGSLGDCTGAGSLIRVTMPDFRREDFAYYPSGPSAGKLMSITEVGVGGAESRTWTYTWSGDDLIEIERPDLTRLVFTYGDPTHESYLTRVDLYPNQGGPRRVLRGWEYDLSGNVIKTWAGADAYANGVDRWALEFDDPEQPTETTVTDPLGNDTVYTIGRDTVSLKPRIESVSSPTGGCGVCGLSGDSLIAYDPIHPLLPATVTDGEGNVTTYTYDANGRTLTRTEAVNEPTLTRTTRWEYDADFGAFPTLVERPSVSGTGFRLTEMVYDPVTGDLESRQLTGVEETFVPQWPPTPPPGTFDLTTVFTYNGAGQPETIDPPGYEDPGGLDVTTYEYDDPLRGDQLPSARIDPVIGATSFEYDAFNRASLVTDPNGVMTETRYDEMGRVRYVRQLAAGSSPGGSPPFPAADLVTEHVYDEYEDLLRTILPEGNVVEYGHDGAGRMTSVARKPDAATNGERIDYTLDGAGNRTLESLKRWDPGAGAFVEDSATETVYTVRCRPDALIRGAGTPEASTTEYAYDCNNNLIRVWDENHPGADPDEAMEYGYDELDRLTTATQPWTGGSDAVVEYEYDVQDHLISVTDGEGNETTFVYSDRDLMTEETSPASGTATHRYNEHGELASTTDARAVTVARIVDPLDRVLTIDYADDGLDVDYTYDDPAVPFSNGRLTRIERGGGAGGSVAYEYDRFGRLTRDGQLQYEHDENGNRTRIVYPPTVVGSTWAADYTYDFADRQATLSFQVNANPPQTVVASAAYQAFGPLREAVLGGGLLTETRGFDSRYEPDRITLADASKTLLDWDYTVDGVGNPTAIADLVSPANDRSFGYRDFQYFLTCAAGPWSAAGSDCGPVSGTPLEWTYDKIGNRLTQTSKFGTTTYAYPVNGSGGNAPRLQMAGSNAYHYDAAGNLTMITGPAGLALVEPQLTLTYDQESRLRQLEAPKATAAMSYDGRGFLRHAQQPPGFGEAIITDPTYDSAGRLMFYAKADSLFFYVPWDMAILYFAGRPVASREEGWYLPPSLTYVTTDHLGTPILLADEAGSVVWQGGFEPFGGDYGGAAASGVELRLPGQLDDDRWEFSGLYYNVHRWYQPDVGRYTRTDPIGLTGGVNLYSYVLNRPTFATDPTGLRRRLKPTQQRWRHCTGPEWEACAAQCGPRGVESCRVSQIWTVVRVHRAGPQLWKWKDVGLSCNCNEDPNERFCSRHPAVCATGVVVGVCVLVLTPWPDDVLIPPLVGAAAL
jgi:RHS repeat-associated protein